MVMLQNFPGSPSNFLSGGSNFIGGIINFITRKEGEPGNEASIILITVNYFMPQKVDCVWN